MNIFQIFVVPALEFKEDISFSIPENKKAVWNLYHSHLIQRFGKCAHIFRDKHFFHIYQIRHTWKWTFTHSTL